MTRMTPLLERNEQFSRTYTPVALGLPAAQVLVVTCLDHRVGHVYDIATGRVTTTLDARCP